ncbi:hypothetical protein [Kitasatospora cheerisanensis]|uniref:Uncharacterized protein n=1 Tax=Kitasatospora cheerisanensis KCTC 2395 TaxID=1348663 RepID=A0A066Z3J9_9ACTN|nr:hypothetical protein [Kitasatospora cheerisanensis]KDN84710.1 hypothetical protein KCH_35750 [Kitasatospora cheerisanensis KCTC 2395]
MAAASGSAGGDLTAALGGISTAVAALTAAIPADGLSVVPDTISADTPQGDEER